MDKKTPFSQWTIEWDHLISVSSEVRNAILDASWIYEEANKINEERSNTNDAIDQVLSTKEEDNVDKWEIESILEVNHPRSQALYDFVTSSEENKEWYLKNQENIKLVDDWIEILWDVFCLKDEKAPDWEWISNNNWHAYFDYISAQKHAEENWKRIPQDWSKYTEFLPWEDENKVKFLTKVLWLSFAGYRSWYNGYYNDQSTFAYYWSSTTYSFNAYHLYFTTSYINPANNHGRGNGFRVRCLKN